MHAHLRTTLLLLFLFFSPFALSKMLWSDASISLLHGTDYKVGDEERTVMTLEFVSGHSWGDSFFFMDRLRSSDGSLETYSELQPRLSLGKVSGSTIGGGPIADVLIATQWEMSGGEDNYLYGIGLDWKIPGFIFFQTNLYMRANDDGTKDDNQQLTVVWGLPFSLGGQDFMFDGFMDYATAYGNDSVDSMNLTPQLKWNMSNLLSWTNQAYLGIEYVYWTNKFGIEDSDAFETNESNLNLLLKVHFK